MVFGSLRNGPSILRTPLITTLLTVLCQGEDVANFRRLRRIAASPAAQSQCCSILKRTLLPDSDVRGRKYELGCIVEGWGGWGQGLMSSTLRFRTEALCGHTVLYNAQTSKTSLNKTPNVYVKCCLAVPYTFRQEYDSPRERRMH